MSHLIKQLIEAARDAARALRFLTPDQFAENRAELRELGDLLQDTLDALDED